MTTFKIPQSGIYEIHSYTSKWRPTGKKVWVRNWRRKWYTPWRAKQIQIDEYEQYEAQDGKMAKYFAKGDETTESVLRRL